MEPLWQPPRGQFTFVPAQNHARRPHGTNANLIVPVAVELSASLEPKLRQFPRKLFLVKCVELPLLNTSATMIETAGNFPQKYHSSLLSRTSYANDSGLIKLNFRSNQFEFNNYKNVNDFAWNLARLVILSVQILHRHVWLVTRVSQHWIRYLSAKARVRKKISDFFKCSSLLPISAFLGRGSSLNTNYVTSKANTLENIRLICFIQKRVKMSFGWRECFINRPDAGAYEEYLNQKLVAGWLYCRTFCIEQGQRASRKVQSTAF